MYRRRHKPEDFHYLTPSTIFVTNLVSFEISDVRKAKTPKAKTPKSVGGLVKQSRKCNESRPRTKKDAQTPRARRKVADDEFHDITNDELNDGPIETSAEEAVNSGDAADVPPSGESRPIRIRRKSSKFTDPLEVEDTVNETGKTKSKKLKNTRISDFFTKSVTSASVEPAEEPVPSTSGAGIKSEPEEINPDLPHIPGVVWKVGAKCEAMDFRDGSWYRSKIVAVSEEHKMVRIHFEGWKPKFDEWYMMETDMIRAAASDWADMDPTKMKGKRWKKCIKTGAPKKQELPTEQELPAVEQDAAPDEMDTSQESVAPDEEPVEYKPEELVFLNELKFEVGARVEAQDKTNHWYRGKIIVVSEEQQVVKVHYDGWKSRWDCWYTMDSERLRPLTRDWVDPRFLPKLKKKAKKRKKSVETGSEEVPEPLEEPLKGNDAADTEFHPIDEIASPTETISARPVEATPKKKRKKSLDQEDKSPLKKKIKLGSTPEVLQEDTEEKHKKRKKKKKVKDVENEDANDLMEYLPEAIGGPRVVLEEVVDTQEEPVVKSEPPDEISYGDLLGQGEKGTQSPEKKKRAKRKKKAKSDANEWASEELLDHVTSENVDDNEPEETEIPPPPPPVEEKKKTKGRGRPRRSTDVLEPEMHEDPGQDAEFDAPAEEESEEPVPEPRSPKKSKVKKQKGAPKAKKVRSRKSSVRESMSEVDADTFDQEPPEESPPSANDEGEEYSPAGKKKIKKKGKKGRAKKFFQEEEEEEELAKGAEWKTIDGDEFMDIPPPTSEVIPKKKKKIKKKEKKVKKVKPVPEYTDAYNKAMMAMSLAEEKERRRVERKIDRLKQKELLEKSKKKHRRGGPSAYQLFCNSNRPRLMTQNPGASFSLINKKLGETWHNIGEREKAVWRRKAKKMKDKSALVPKATKYAKKVKELSSLLKPGQRSVQGLEQQAGAYVPTFGSQASPYKVTGTEPLDAAAHLKLLGESLSIIGLRLTEHTGQFAVQGTVSVMLDSFLCSLGPLMALTSQVPEMDAIPQKTLGQTLDSIAYFMPGL